MSTQHVLLIDDCEADVEALTRIFRKLGIKHPLHHCPDARNALDFLRRQGPFTRECAPRPSLILLDLNMPGIDEHDA